MSVGSKDSTRNINDSRKQALHALISSLAPNESSAGGKKLSEEQVDAISERLDEILDPPAEGSGGGRNERDELLNEEGLPIVDITEPIGDESDSTKVDEALVSEDDPAPLWTLSDQERQRLHIRNEQILDMLEEEESREAARTSGRERLPQAEDPSKMDAERRAAAREMQRKLGKALLMNLAAQREKEEEEKRKAREVAASSSQDGESSRRQTKKCVKFANVPEVDEEKPKPKPSVAWGDVSATKLRAGVPKAKLKAEVLAKQPMKSKVVERVPGAERISVEERDSDDESNPDEYASDGEGEETTPSFDGDFEDTDQSTREGDDSEEDEFDLSQARMQREVALEYIRLRETVGSETRKAMTSHTHGEDDWDQPEVPLEATLSSKAPKGGMSRFKVTRQANFVALGNDSVSLGGSILPQDKLSSVRKVVRIGKLESGQLVGEEAGDSGLEDENESVKQMIEMLKAGIVVDDGSMPSDINPTKAVVETVTERVSSPMPEPSQTSPSNPTPAKTSLFLSGRATQKQTSPGPAKGPPSSVASSSSPLSATVLERSLSQRPTPSPSIHDIPPESSQTMSNSAFKRSPSIIPVPSVPSQRRPFATPQIKPDPAVLSSMIVESPSFPPPNTTQSTTGRPTSTPLVSEVRESTRRAGVNENERAQSTQRAGKVSRFKAERS